MLRKVRDQICSELVIHSANRVSIKSCCQRSTGQTGNILLCYQRLMLPSNHYSIAMWFHYYQIFDYVLTKNMSRSGSLTQIAEIRSYRQVSKLVPSALWQEVRGALWPLHPDLTGMNISYAILFLLIPHPDLSQLLSDLKQEFIDSQKLHNLSTDVPFLLSPGCLGRDYHQSTHDGHQSMCTYCKEKQSEWVKSPV